MVPADTTQTSNHAHHMHIMWIDVECAERCRRCLFSPNNNDATYLYKSIYSASKENKLWILNIPVILTLYL